MTDPCVPFAVLHDAMRAAGVDVLVRRGGDGALSVSLVDHDRRRSVAVPVPPRGFDAAATVLCCSLALAAAPLRREWPELASLAWSRA
jgi:hypothetical protein